MTDRIYYTAPYAREFDAIVQRVEPVDDQTLVVLDRTAFYPTSGGQPHDVGALGGLPVGDVIDLPDGSIGHRVAGRLAEGQRVHGAIDWERRFDHMQQHTGQHLLSAAFDRLLSARTDAFHLGTSASTIDLSRSLGAEAIAEAETEANRIVWENRPVAIKFVSGDETARLPLRKDPARTGVLRVIDIDRFDLSACGGTHVDRTGAVGLIAISSWERFKGGTRVTFVCGHRALTSFRALHQTAAASARLLSVAPGELPAAIERAQADAREARRLAKDLEQRLLVHEAAALAERAVGLEEWQVVAEAIPNSNPRSLKDLAAAIVARPRHVVVLVSDSTPAQLVVARAADASLDARAVVETLVGRFGGRGGGRPELAQGGGLQAAPEVILAAAREAIAV